MFGVGFFLIFYDIKNEFGVVYFFVILERGKGYGKQCCQFFFRDFDLVFMNVFVVLIWLDLCGCYFICIVQFCYIQCFLYVKQEEDWYCGR